MFDSSGSGFRVNRTLQSILGRSAQASALCGCLFSSHCVLFVCCPCSICVLPLVYSWQERACQRFVHAFICVPSCSICVLPLFYSWQERTGQRFMQVSISVPPCSIYVLPLFYSWQERMGQCFVRVAGGGGVAGRGAPKRIEVPYICTYIYMCVCIYIHTCTHTHTHLYIYIFVCAYTYIYMHTHICIHKPNG